MGYSFARQGSSSFNGWNAAVVGNYNHWFGIAVDVSGHYASQDGFVQAMPVVTSRHLYALRAGPRFKLPAFGKVAPFAQALLGGNYARATSNSKVMQETQVSEVKSRGFAAAVGFGFDYDLNDVAAFRILQADYSVLKGPGAARNGFRLATGIVFKFD
ncbi:MAG TPA: hypothetical protein VE422_17975 [Terriglobia bacterium]|nr:hypothetical protein [Terriglobia bacterium]